MNSQIYKLALLSKIDDELDERKEEFGDLPEKLKNIKIKFEEAKKRLEESEQILSDNKKFAANAKVKLKALKEKEDKLSKQQFLVRNNKEFDAITKEIENIRDEYSKLCTELRTTGIKEENLTAKIDEQKEEVKNVESDYEEAKEEFNTITNDQDEDVKRLVKRRKDTLKKINKELKDALSKIRIAMELHPELTPSGRTIAVRKKLSRELTAGALVATDENLKNEKIKFGIAYADGDWKQKDEFLENKNKISLSFLARGKRVYAVAESRNNDRAVVSIRADGKFLKNVRIKAPDSYCIAEFKDAKGRVLTLECKQGIAVYSFSFIK